MTTLPRRAFLQLAAGAAALPAVSHLAQAQSYPNRQITLTAPWPAGGAIDALCRIIAPRLGERLGKPIVVENRPGAGSVLGVAVGARAVPDGYTLTMAGIEMTHVPYKGSAPALTDVIAGHLPLLFSDTIPSLPMIREGKVRAFGVSTALRLPSAPDIPPIAEVGLPGFDASGWGMIVAPTGTSNEVISKVHAAVLEVQALANVRERIVRLGMVPATSAPPDKLQGMISSEIERWAKIIRQAGLAGSEG